MRIVPLTHADALAIIPRLRPVDVMEIFVFGHGTLGAWVEYIQRGTVKYALWGNGLPVAVGGVIEGEREDIAWFSASDNIYTADGMIAAAKLVKTCMRAWESSACGRPLVAYVSPDREGAEALVARLGFTIEGECPTPGMRLHRWVLKGA